MTECRHSRRGSLERGGVNCTEKNTQQSTRGTYQEEHILEGEGLLLGVLGVGERHYNVMGGVALPRQAKCSINKLPGSLRVMENKPSEVGVILAKNCLSMSHRQELRQFLVKITPPRSVYSPITMYYSR